jgi:hypothetical protein
MRYRVGDILQVKTVAEALRKVEIIHNLRFDTPDLIFSKPNRIATASRYKLAVRNINRLIAILVIYGD